ncbi:MAG TPA: aminotransferase class IV [Prolixibacteraceae bacterium]|nr:aminotransferase class IV [Prolixibacteraceae bacterium]
MVLFNDKYITADNLPVYSKQAIIVYEVMRLIDRVPLFFEDHFERLLASCFKINHTINIDAHKLLKQLISLGSQNGIREGNVMIKVIFEKNTHDIIATFIPHKYPNANEYLNGVALELFYAQRENPEAKVVQQSIRSMADDLIREKKVYEVLLVNQQNTITEGSRSNCFFIKNNCLYTAPLSSVLKGITLLKVIEIAQEKNIEIEYRAITVSEISEYDAMFLTGTSPKILPVARLGEYHYNAQHKMIRILLDAYNLLINRYVAEKKETYKSLLR